MPLRINRELFTVVDSAAERAEDNVVLEIEGEATVEIRFTETDQTDPAGRYRLRVTGDGLVFERAASADWATATEIFRIESAAMGFFGATAVGQQNVPLTTPSVQDVIDALVALGLVEQSDA